MTYEQFYDAYKPLALQVQAKYNIPWEVVLTQASIESAWGVSAPGNMFFGIKADNWSGEKQQLPTQEYINGKMQNVYAWFRKYPSALASFMDYGALISSPYYTQFHHNTRDPFAFAEAVAKAGYATAPNYAQALKDRITLLRSIDSKKKEAEQA